MFEVSPPVKTEVEVLLWLVWPVMVGAAAATDGATSRTARTTPRASRSGHPLPARVKLRGHPRLSAMETGMAYPVRAPGCHAGRSPSSIFRCFPRDFQGRRTTFASQASNIRPGWRRQHATQALDA